MRSRDVTPSADNRLIVASWTGWESSLSTTRATSIMPASIMAAAISMPFMKPRQALVTSKFWQAGDRPRASWMTTAVDGSSQRRLREVLMSRSTCPGAMSLAARAAWPAATAPSVKAWSSAQRRRSRMPTRPWSSPARMRVRR